MMRVSQFTALPRLATLCASLAWISFCFGLTFTAMAQAPLHQRIDEQVVQHHVGPVSPVASDADFVRRIYLDLIGSIPSAAESRQFIADTSPDKRAKLIDSLLNSSRHARHLANQLDVMLMERRADKYVPAADWQKYLYDSMLANKPYDQLVREILTSDGTDPATRPAAKFVLDREVEPNLLTRDIGRIFFGRDLQCAQCHDHPLVDDYYQADYYGLQAFFSRSQIFTYPAKDKVPALTVLMDNAAGEVSFQSVFDPTAKGNTLPRVPGGKQLEEPRFNLGDEWTVAPAKDVRHVPKYSRRAQLAGQVAVPTNRQFNRNIVNRLWAQMLGVGLVEPVDFQHSGNPPTHPQLLEMLADDIVAMKYDMRAFLREIALSQTYQRSLDLPADFVAQAANATAVVATLEGEQTKLADQAKVQRDAHGQVVTALTDARKALPPVAEELTKALAPVADVQKGIAAAAQALTEAEGKLAPKREVATTVAAAAAKAKEAAAKLPEEKDLAEAATRFQARADQLAAEVAPLAKAVEEKTAAASAAKEKLVAINQQQVEINTRLDAVRKQVIALEQQEEAAAEVGRTSQYQAKLVQRRLDEAKAQAQLVSLTTSAQQAQAAKEKLAADIAAAKATEAKLAADLPALQTAEAAAQKANADAQAALANAKQLLTTKQTAQQEFTAVLATAEAAAQKLAGDAEVAQSVEKLKARAAQLTAEVAEAQKGMAASEELAKTTTVALTTATQTVATTVAQRTQLAQQIPAMETQVVAADQKVAADSAAAKQAVLELPDRWAREFATRPLRQLTPEQFGWSILRATGVYENYVAAVTAEVEKATPLTDAIKADPSQMALRARQIDEGVYAKLASNVNVFVQLFGAGAGQPQSDFFSTVDQALFLANGGVVKSWLAPSGENLTARLLKIEDAKQLADELYVSVLSRSPTEVEVAEVAKYLAARPQEKPVVVQELAWSLLSAAEFRFNR